MARILNTVVCCVCHVNFKTSSSKFTECPACRDTTRKNTLITNFPKSSFGKWLVHRISQSGTFKVMSSGVTHSSLSELYLLWKARRRYSQSSYCHISDEWASKLSLHLCHLYPLKGSVGCVGELTTRNLVIAPSTLNNQFKNTVFNTGYYVKSNSTLTIKQAKKMLITRYGAEVLKFQQEHNLLPVNKKPIATSFSITEQEYTLITIAIMEATRLGIEVFQDDDSDTIFNRILKGASTMNTIHTKAPATLSPDECDEVRLWSTHHKVKEFCDKQLSLYYFLSTNDDRFNYVTMRDKNFSKEALLDLESSGLLRDTLINTFESAAIGQRLYTFIVNAWTSFNPDRLHKNSKFVESDEF
ncbi:MAG: hypothetical protein HRT55_16905 [Colwellia sp.]|uniref:hypothetical protein n=1 Tax=Alteromonadales TaxID=135622 RepID=UPI001DAF69BC|nr:MULTISPECIES: hypothetical protein [Alteromonadales]NQZ27984.1 hypothetical protein [Colwellia sp.]NRA81384.1 hypothetical protein [Pseudoalteromonas sp.]